MIARRRADGRSGRDRGQESAVDRHRAGVRARPAASCSSSLYGGLLTGSRALLFGTFLGITAGQVLTLLGVAVVALALLAVVGRPLLFASVDGAWRAPRGVPARAARRRLPAAAGLAVAEDRADHRRAARLRAAGHARRRPPSCSPPARRSACCSPSCSACWSPGSAWARLLLDYPVGFYITTVAFGVYVLARASATRSSPTIRRCCAARPRPVGGCGLMFAHEFMRNALLAGTFDRAGVRRWSATSWCCARRCSPATRSATSPSPARSPRPPPASTSRIGLFAATIVVALLLGALGERGRRRRRRDRHRLRLDPRARRALPRALQQRLRRRRTARRRPRRCSARSSGSAAADARLAALVGARGHRVAVLAIARPLLFATSTRRSRPRGACRCGRSGSRFLALLGATAAEATQAVGALLLLGLLAAPAGAAHRLTARPYLGLGAVGRARGRSRCGSGSSLSYAIPPAAEHRDHRGRRPRATCSPSAHRGARREASACLRRHSESRPHET